MPDTDPKLGLALPILSDPFSTATLRSNWEKLIAHPGIFVAATAANLPGTWASANTGMMVYQVDEGVLWRWNGSAFVRQHAKGHLGTTRRTSDLTVTSGTYAVVAQQAVTVPEGERNIRITGAWGEVTGGAARLALFRGATQLRDLKVTSDGGEISYVDLAPAAGATTYSLQAKNVAGTTTIKAAVSSPASIDVVEV